MRTNIDLCSHTPGQERAGERVLCVQHAYFVCQVPMPNERRNITGSTSNDVVTLIA